MHQPRPATVVMIAFATGSVTVQSAAKRESIIAAMKGDDNGEITLKSISQTEVKENPRGETRYVLTDEEIHFNKKDVVFWSLSVASDPPKVLVMTPKIQGV